MTHIRLVARVSCSAILKWFDTSAFLALSFVCFCCMVVGMTRWSSSSLDLIGYPVQIAFRLEVESPRDLSVHVRWSFELRFQVGPSVLLKVERT